jgi:hypothetical protein
MKDLKICPYCSEEIMEVANKCKHCGKWFNNNSSTQATIPKDTVEKNNSERTQIIINQVAQQKNGVGTAGFTLSLIGFLLGWVPFVGWILWLLGAIFSFVGLFKKPKGLAIAGFIITWIYFIVLFIVIFVVFGGIAAFLGKFGLSDKLDNKPLFNTEQYLETLRTEKSKEIPDNNVIETNAKEFNVEVFSGCEGCNEWAANIGFTDYDAVSLYNLANCFSECGNYKEAAVWYLKAKINGYTPENYVTVNTKGDFPDNLLRIRSTPNADNTNSNFVIGVPKGETVEILEQNVKQDYINGESGYWIKIRYSGKGYDKWAKSYSNSTWEGYAWEKFLEAE